MKNTKTFCSLINVFLLLLICNLTTYAQSDLFISEYVEGWANNKAIELYNPTESPINLSGYQLVRYSNGSDAPPATGNALIVLPDYLLEPYKTCVLVLDKRVATGTGQEVPIWSQLQDRADFFLCPVYNDSKAMYYNGNDAVALEKTDGTLVDLFARWGAPDPNNGAGWTTQGPSYLSGGVSVTADHTLIRKSSVKSGVIANPTIFNALAEYDSLPANTFENLGWHTFDAAPANTTPTLDINPIYYVSPFAEEGDVVMTLIGQDTDDGQQLEYYLTSGNFIYIGEGDDIVRHEPFKLEKATGRIIVADELAIAQATESIWMNVTVCDEYSQSQEYSFDIVISEDSTHFVQPETDTLTMSDVIFADGVITNCVDGFSKSNIIIPAKLNGQAVKQIAQYAFYGKGLRRVTIANSIDTIGARAFSNNNLVSVVFENNSHLLFIGTSAFGENSSLQNVIFPNSSVEGFVSYISEGETFSEGANLPNFEEEYKTNYLYTLKDDDVVIEDGIITSTTVESLSIVIPNFLDGQAVTGIGNNAFSNKSLISIALPNTIDSIAYYAFRSNPMLKDVTFAENSNIQYITTSAFYETSVTNLILPTSSVNGFIKYKIETIGYEFERYYRAEGDVVRATSSAYDYSITTVINYTLQDKDVVIEDGIIKSGTVKGDFLTIPISLDSQTVTGIGENAFSNKSLEGLSLPNTIDSIAPYAFSNNSLDSIVIPKSIQSIGDGAFSSNSLHKVLFEDNSHLLSLGTSVFGSNDNLREIKLPSSAYDDFVSYGFSFYWDGSMHSQMYGQGSIISIPNNYWERNPLNGSLTTYLDYTLTDDDVIIENGVITGSTIEAVSLTIPSTLSGQSITGIGENAFSNKSLIGLTLPSSIDSIAPYAFSNNTILDNVTFPNNSLIRYLSLNAFNETSIHQIILPESGLDDFVLYKIENDYNSSYINTGEQVSINSYENRVIKSLTRYTLQDDDVVVEEGKITSVNTNSEEFITIPNYIDGQYLTAIGQGVFSNKNLKSVILPNGLKEIEDYAFSHNQLDSILIPNSVTSIKRDAFNSNYLSKVDFETNSQLLMIKQSAFSDNYALQSIVLPTSGVEGFLGYYDQAGGQYNEGDLIEDYYKEYLVNRNYTLTDEDVVIKDGIVISCSISGGTITIPNTLDNQSIIGIGNQAFADKGLLGVSLPETVQIIKEGAFNSNLLTEITLPNSVNSLENYAFSFNQIETLSIPEGVNSIGESAFSDNALVSISLPSSLTTIRDNAFSYNKLTSLILPTSLTTIGEFAFSNNKLTSIELPNGIKSIAYSAFSSNKLSEISIPFGITSIDKSAFAHNPLTVVTLPSSLVQIGERAFYGDSTLEEIVLPTPTKNGHKLIGWQEANSTIIHKEGTSVSTYEEYTAIFEYDSYDLGFDANGGEGNMEVMNITFMANDIIPANNYTKEPFIFTGWATTAEGPAVYSEGSYYTMLTEGEKLFAKWAFPSYIVTYENEGELYYMYKTNNYPATSALPNMPIKEGYTFAGWYSEAGGTGEAFTLDTEISNNITVYAKWTEGSSDLKSIASSRLGIYPNPASESILLVGIEGAKDVEIYSLNGVLLIQKLQIVNNTPIDISALNSGVYSVKVGEYSEKLIIE